ncbi:hypothetical protein [Lentzea jiangxiensis]|uniref:Uncharacterized protein n=1 Tax=Lentzea jiangxiensis TaxID=641025 RepID=A0A1H0V5W0_9PSEU|nr:hypothetical protein [Lentzea jiangxiensis]SDP73919.1 hypothetical protein SAMN05421507_113193 [Lentzea jiangxiensis]
MAVLLLLTAAAACTGPAEPATSGFVKLGALRGKPPEAAELTGDVGDSTYRALRRVSAGDNEQARELLTRPRAGGTRTFAFVEPGCVETGAVPVVTGDVLDVRLTGGANTACAQASYFLVTVTAEDPDNRLRLRA